MLDLDLPLYDCHSELDHSPVVKVLALDEIVGYDTHVIGLNANGESPESCILCRRLDVQTSFSTKAEVQSHFRSWYEYMRVSGDPMTY